MEISKDFKEFLACLNGMNVEYVLVGGYAVAFHGAPRYTGDIDIFVRPTRENGTRVIEAMKEFGYLPPEVIESDFEKTTTVIQMGVPPFRIDVITGIDGVTWEEALLDRVSAKYGDVNVHYIGFDALVRNKSASGRPKDIMDLDNLGKLDKARATKN